MKIDIDKIKMNNENPRIIKDNKFKKLIKSIKDFPEMLEKRPLIIDENNVVLGGNMRLKALEHLKYKKVPVIQVTDWSEEKKKEFIIKDNVGFGEWDWDMLANEWDIKELQDWGVNVPTIKDTELLSNLEYKSMYYEPIEKPYIKLEDCVDLDKYNKKIKALDEFNLTQKQKKILKLFTYRFIKIDFENVANYYYFNASDEEKKAIERLRLVLTDDGVNGFIEDDLLRILSFTDSDLKL